MRTVEQRTTSLAEFGDQLRRWRMRANLSQSQVGARVGYHHSQISKLENGTRRPSIQVVRKLDTVLETGGRLSQVFAAGGLSSWNLLEPMAGTNMGGTGECGPAAPGMDPWNLSGWPSRLPDFGLSCPLHGNAVCDVPTAAAAVATYATFSSGQRVVDTEVVHVLTAVLASYAKLAREQGPSGVVGVESTLRSLIMALNAAEGRPSRSLLKLAAAFAALAGEQRMARGQHGAATAWNSKGLHWAAMCGDIATRVVILCNMSMLARLENDAPNALAYAREMRADGLGRPWVSTLAQIYAARGYARLGEYRETKRSIERAREELTRFGERDELEAPWLSRGSGQVFVEVSAAGGLRDIAAATADRAVAMSAARSIENALMRVSAQMRPSRVLMKLRLADSYACAGEPEAALETAFPLVTEQAALSSNCLRQEMRGLRSRLVARWGEQPAVREFVGSTNGYAA